MSARRLEVVRGYRDSVQLMQISAALRALPGVSAALVAMATDVNVDLATKMGFAPPPTATPNDMLVALAGTDESALDAARQRLDAELSRPPPSGGGVETVPPRTVGSAVRRAGANLALVSTPGRYAYLDALDALSAGASVLLFSDNVSVEHEVRLKDEASRRGLFVFGPDCGTAVIGGVGLGFANVVRPGPMGLVAASGTGAQHVMSLLAAAGVGISHCLGVGGRDLSAEVAGRATVACLDALDADPETELIVLVSKPPAAGVAARVKEHAAGLGTPVEFALLGAGQPDLTASVEGVLRRLGVARPEWPRWGSAVSGSGLDGSAAGLRGLFCGGTLRDEARLIVDALLGPGATMIDFGDDEFTRGRPHPMIDGAPRRERLAAEAADPGCRVVLLDVVLGYAADPDPSATLAPAIKATSGPAIVVSLTGTDDDPQGLQRQATALADAGATVFLSNAEAARFAAGLIRGGAP